MKLRFMLPVLLLIFIAPAMAVAQTTPSDTIKGQIEVYLGPDGAASNEALLQLYTERADSIQVILDEVKNANDPARRASLLALHARIKDMEQDASLNALNASGGLRSSHFWMALIMSLALFAVIIDLVRRKLLRIEYSWLWVLTGVAIVALVLTGALNLISTIIGARVPQTLFFSGVVFLTLINLHYSVAISRLSNQAKKLSQELAILKHETESATPAPQDRGSTQ